VITLVEIFLFHPPPEWLFRAKLFNGCVAIAPLCLRPLRLIGLLIALSAVAIMGTLGKAINNEFSKIARQLS
jgi:hypothetical protein